MEQPPRPTDLVSAAGISMSYASEILAGKRSPSRALAIHILRKVGWRHASIETLSDEEIELLGRLDPWKDAA